MLYRQALRLNFVGAISFLAQNVQNFGQETLKDMSKGGPKGRVIRQFDRNLMHSNKDQCFTTKLDLASSMFEI